MASDNNEPQMPPQQQLQNALSMPIPRLYANGFMVAQTASDLFVVSLSNGTPSMVLNMSHISAKTLSAELQKALQEFERRTQSKVPTIEEVAAVIGSSQ